jgi:hypothetical protein
VKIKVVRVGKAKAPKGLKIFFARVGKGKAPKDQEINSNALRVNP